MSFFALESRRTFSMVLFFIMLATPHIYARPLPGPDLYAEITSIDSGTTLRTLGGRAGLPDCYQVAMPEAGFLMIDASVSAAAEAAYDVRIGVLEPIRVVHQSTTHLLLHSDVSRSVSFCVGPQDPTQRLDEYRLRTAFHAYRVAAPTSSPDRAEDPEEIELEPEGLHLCLPFQPMDRAEDPEEIELEPEGLRVAMGTKEEDPEEIELEPEGLRLCGPLVNHAEDPEEIELEPEGLVAGVLGSLCGAPYRDDPYRDDHGDNFLCGTPMALGSTAHGEISNAWGDDQDVFAFELAETTTVQIHTKGSVAALATLHDAGGQRLHVAGGKNGGASVRVGNSIRLVKTLRPGVYFVKLAGSRDSEGPYSMKVQALRWSW